ncbi:flavin-containing monooxygenase [Gordonia hankookensis]|uniref:NAD(P)/FAD-dependent oxidoreductase n=1 Tax=Gordonia hankookensis TaxID=589403 RepID=A0ABR7WB75_9ACTN|nr:NAD(P)/FAD-dependent oxidoreductase [Gordonia hankookensis]MBD1320063.1 NAD(P)/FAD-dependent oxidoreductase [Gordonia hankookensis]
MTTSTTTESIDVLIVGAGISGIGVARYLSTEHPAKSFAIVEARAVAGGTWDLFRYPGIRSDSDLHTFGYEFKPWTDKQAIADAPRILDYLHETIDENGLTEHIRYQHRVVSAAWSSDDARWLVEIDRGDTGERVRISAGWIFCGSGYYDYDEGFTPEFEGRERFQGQIVHPQHWPEDLDYAGKRVVVIGSGATAVTLLPAMADDAEHVTMLQRTPTYIIPLPREDAIANALKKVLGDKRGYALTRQKNVAQQRLLFELCQRFPSVARRMIRKINASQLPEGYPVDTHFNPPYNPWDQRLCVVPDSDLFRTIRKGKASIVTDRIATFTETGVLLESGEELEADIVVTATGLNIKIIGGIDLSVDGRPVSLPDTVVYRGMMLSGVPNFALAIGYTNASWTLKIGLLCEYFCQLLTYMDRHGYDNVWAVADPAMPTRPLLDFGAGYVQRALATLPKQGPEAPWVMSMSYYADRRLLRGDVEDEHLHFSGARDRAGKSVGV